MLGERLKWVRKEKGLTQKAFSEPLGTSSGYISEVEQGKKTPGSDFLISLSRVWGVSIDWLLIGEGAPYKSSIDEGGGSPKKLPAKTEIQSNEMLQDFTDRQRALNITRDLAKLEKLDPGSFIRIESYIKGTVDTVKEIAKSKTHQRPDTHKCQRRIQDLPDKIPGGKDRRSGLDRRKACG